jgi:hypothetical protein
MVFRLIILFILGALVIITTLIFYFIQNKIYKLLKERHIDTYNQLGQPSIWKLQNFAAFSSIQYGKVKFPEDLELSQNIIALRVSAIILILAAIAMAIFSFYMINSSQNEYNSAIYALYGRL